MGSENALTESGVTKGSVVEVCSDEEGFRGAWYRAILEESPSKSKRRKLRIRYMTLLKDDNLSPLSEVVEPSFVRPSPPEATPVPGEVFGEGDVVDAGYKDGWWTGVVRRILEDGRYVVCFDNPPDVIEFEGKDLRKHFDWIDGNWVRAERQELKSSAFSPGTSMELRPGTEDLSDVWVPVVVIKENEDGTVLVKYKSLRDGDDAESRRADVDSRFIRPSPLPCKDAEYKLLDRVDVRHESGWREGVVTRILSGNTYTVFCKRTKECADFGVSDLRHSMEWKTGMWETEPKVGTPPPDHSTPPEHSNGNANNSEQVVGSEKSPRTRTEERASSKRLRVKFADRPTSVCESYSVSTAKKLKLTRPSVGGKQSISSELSNGGYAAESQASIRTERARNMQNRTPAVQANHALSTPRAKSTRRATRLAADGETSIETKASVTKVAAREKQRLCGKTNGKIADAVTNENTPVKFEQAATEAASKESDSLVVLGIRATSLEETEAKAQGKASPRKTLRTIKAQKGSANDSLGEKETEELKNSKISYKRKKIQRGKIVSPEFCQADAPDQNSGGASGDVPDDDQPLSTWIGVNSSLAAEELSLSSTRTPDAVNGSQGEKQLSVVETPRQDDAVDGSPGGKQPGVVKTPRQDDAVDGSAGEKQLGVIKTPTTIVLPFVKKSPLWDSFESMEVFKTVPQRPHFSPLLETKEVYREGSAIGIMVTFSGLLEKVNDLLLDDPRSTLESIKEGLIDVEKHGFDVAAPLCRVNELLSLKDKQMQSLDERENVDKKIEECHNKSLKCEKDIDGITRKIHELQRQQAELRNLKLLTDAEKGRLLSLGAALDQDIQNVEQEFQKIATAPWKSPETPL